jgi:hypothetical protein
VGFVKWIGEQRVEDVVAELSARGLNGRERVFVCCGGNVVAALFGDEIFGGAVRSRLSPSMPS